MRLLPTLNASGATHMCLDEALLSTANELSLRIYYWNPPCVSLGYFQDYDEIMPQLPANIDVVRRITGGGAIWHQHEVTYSLAGILGEDGLPQRTQDCYPILHAGIQAALAESGAQLSRQDESIGDRRYRQEPRCFASPAADDLIRINDDSGGENTDDPHGKIGKVLGSAGRCRGKRILIHGSLKLASNPWDREVVAGCGLDQDTAQQALQNGIAQALDQNLVAGQLTAAEECKRDQLLTQRYESSDWVVKRIGPKA